MTPYTSPLYRPGMTQEPFILKRSIEVPFKGTRTYLQSANIWDSVAETLLDGSSPFENFNDPATMLDITFRALAGTQLDLELSEKRLKAGPKETQVIATSAGKTRLFGTVIPSEYPVQSQSEDLELFMKTDAEYTQTQAEYTGEIPSTLSQAYIALIKFWHLSHVDSDCKWLATRLQLPLACLMAKPKSVTITPGTILKDGLGSVTDVRAGDDDSLSGRIWFYKT